MQAGTSYRRNHYTYIYLNKVMAVMLVALLMLSFLPAKSNALGPATFGPVTGTLNTSTETDIDGKTIIITLTAGTTWDPNFINIKAKRDALFNSMTTSNEPYEWAKVVSALSAAADAAALDVLLPHVVDVGESVPLSEDYDILTITLPEISNYNIAADQLITVTPPTSLFANVVSLPLPSVTLTILADPAAIVTGTITAGTTAADIVNGGKTIVVTLNGATWDQDVVDNTILREKLIDSFTPSFDSSAVDSDAWEQLQDAIKSSADISSVMTRTSDTVLTITLPPVSNFVLDSRFTVDLTLLGSTLTGGTDVDDDLSPAINPVFEIFTVNTSADLSGTVMAATTEADIESGGKTIIITLLDDSWAPDVATNPTKRNALISGFTASSSESNVWWSELPDVNGVPVDGVLGTIASQSLHDSTIVVKTSSKIVTITLPAVTNYDITANQTINLTIPSSVLSTSSAPLIVPTSFTILPMTAAITGTFVSSPPTKANMVSGGKTIIVTLSNATWVSDVASNTVKRGLLIDGFTGTVPEDWIYVKTALKANAVSIVRNSNTMVTLTFPSVLDPNYSGTAQTVTLSVPPSLITGATTTVVASPNLAIGLTTTAVLNGTIMPNALKSEIISGNETIVISLTDGNWASDIVANSTKRNALLSGFTASSDTTNWNLVLTAIKATPYMALSLSNTVLTITLPPVSSYNIIADQTITLKIPKSVLVQSAADITAVGAFVISAPTHNNNVKSIASALQTDPNLAIYLADINNAFVTVPKKYINTITINPTLLANITIIDVLADSAVDTVTVTVNGKVSILTSFITMSATEKKFTVAYGDLDTSSNSDITFNVKSGVSNLQKDITEKLTKAKKVYTEKPKKDLTGTYTLYQLLNNSTLLKSIIDAYSTIDLELSTTT